MKKILYILSFGFFGLLIATLAHAAIEIVALSFIFGNPDTFADTIWWQEWKLVHGIVASVLWGGGLILGLYLGTIWWEPYGSKPSLYHWRKKK